MVALSFNAQQYTPQYGGGSSLPVGKYKGVIVATGTGDVEKNGVAVGGYLSLELAVVEGPLKDQKMTDRLNLHNSSPKAVEIANKQLAAYCAVTGVFAFNDTDELCGKPFCFEVGWQKGNEPTQEKPEGGYTEIKALWDINGNEPKNAGQGPKQQQQPAAPAAIPTQAISGGVAVDLNTPAPAAQPSAGGWPQQPGPAAAPAQPSPAGGGWPQPGVGGPAPAAASPWGAR